jgi:hypothetical protein
MSGSNTESSQSLGGSCHLDKSSAKGTLNEKSYRCPHRLERSTTRRFAIAALPNADSPVLNSIIVITVHELFTLVFSVFGISVEIGSYSNGGKADGATGLGEYDILQKQL